MSNERSPFALFSSTTGTRFDNVRDECNDFDDCKGVNRILGVKKCFEALVVAAFLKMDDIMIKFSSRL